MTSLGGKPVEERVTVKAAVGYKALLCIQKASEDFMQMHPETLLDKLTTLRRIVSILNGIGQMLVPEWQRVRMEYRAGISNAGVAFRTAVTINDICKDLDVVPPEAIERAARRLKFVMFLMNRIGRDGWLAWRDYDLSVITTDSGISACNSPAKGHNVSNETQLPLFVD
jgi:hypothetical protein